MVNSVTILDIEPKLFLVVLKVILNLYYFFFPATIVPVTEHPVRFLGLSLSNEEAETGLNATFALLIVAAIGAICLTIGFVFTKRRSKKNLNADSVQLERKF